MRLAMTLAVAVALAFAAGCDEEEGDDVVDGGGGDGGADGGDDGGNGDLPPCADEGLWWIWDLSVMPPQDAQIAASVRGEGESVCVVGEDAAWGAAVDQETVDALVTAWDDATPSDGQAGIFDQVTDLFGDPPDVFDEDPRVYLLLYEMAGYGGYSFDGYFKVDDQTAAANSNRHEMLHINTANHAPDSDYMLSIQSHEFQHLIHWGHDADEEGWLDEAMSELAMVLTGFDDDSAWVSSWLNDPSDPLFSNGPDYNYGILLLFGTYLWERFGDELIRDLVEDTANGTDSLEAVLELADPPSTTAEVIGDLALAIAIDDPELADGEYGFFELELGSVGAAGVSVGEAVEEDVPGRGGFAFFGYNGDVDGRSVTVETAGSDDLEVRVAVVGDGWAALAADDLDGELTSVDLDAWSGTATVWIAAANPTSSAIAVTVGIE